MMQSTSPAPRSERRRARPGTVFAVTALGAFLASLDLSIVNIAFPALERSFPHARAHELAWVITAYTITFGALLVAGGRTADRVGRRRVFLGGVAAFTLGSMLCGVAPTLPLLVAGRAFQGAGAAFVLPASLGLLLGAFPAERRSQIVAFWGGVGALAVATGPSLGALIVSSAGWRWVFYVNVPVGAAALLAGRRVLAESEPAPDAASPDYAGVVLLSLAVASLVLGIAQGSTWGWTSPRILGSLVVSVLLGGAFAWRSLHHSAPLVDLTLFRSRSFSAANAATLAYAMGFYAMLLGNVLFLTGVWHYSILRAGLAITPGPLVVAAVSGFAGKVATRVGFRPVLAVGATLFAAGLAWYALRVGADPQYLAVWLPGTLVVGLGIGLTFPVLSAAAVSSLPPERFAVGSAVNQTVRQIGGTVGVALLVALLGVPHSLGALVDNSRHVWVFAAAMAAASGLVAMFLPGVRAVARSGPAALSVAHSDAA